MQRLVMFTLLIAANAFVLLLSSGVANAQEDAPVRSIEAIEADIKQVRDDIEELLLYKDMTALRISIPESSCKTSFREVERKYKQAEGLNEIYSDDLSNPEYVSQAEILKADKRRASEDYLVCFASAASGSTYVRKAGIADRQKFKVKFKALQAKYPDPNLQYQIDVLGVRLYDLEQEFVASFAWHDWDFPEDNTWEGPVGKLTSVFKEVHIKRGPRRWRAEKGSALFLNDIVETGPLALARIEINDRDDQSNAGPTVVNMGSETSLVMSGFRKREEKAASLLDLLEGAIRAYTQGFNGESAFSVRVGTSLCGIRGTDVAVTYDPETKTSEYSLQHGTAFMYGANGERRDLQPGTSQTVIEGRFEESGVISPSDYASIIRTTSSESLSEAQALELASNRFGQSSAIVKPQPASLVQPTGIGSLKGHSVKAWLAFDDFQRLVSRNDMERAVQLTTGKLRSDFEERINNLGWATFVDSGWRPTSWSIDCVECNDQSTCYVFSKLNGRQLSDSSQIQVREAFQMKARAGKWYAAERFPEPDRYDEFVQSCPWR